MKYHHSCYKAYTRIPKSLPSDASQPQAAAYSTFCEIVEERIIKNSETLSINKLKNIFEISAITLNGFDSIEVNNSQLKRWLQRDYPS